MSEPAAQTVKNLLKSAYPYNALLSYRTISLECGYSPSELLMGRQLRIKIHVAPSILEPLCVELKQLQDKQENTKPQ